MGGLNTWKYFTLILLVLLHNECSMATETISEKSVSIHQPLPRVAIPVTYEIKLVPEIVEGNSTHHGEVKIGVKVLQKTSNFTLNSQNLCIDESFTHVIDANGVSHKPKNHTHVKNWILIIEFDQPIDVGIYTLNIKFASNTTNSSGISITSWVNGHDEKVWTMFSGVLVRRNSIFPCWDDFDLRATYNLSIKHLANYTAVSNMPIRRTYFDDDGKQWTNFDVTPPLPLYLMAFVVSNFDCIQDESEVINVCGANVVLPSLKYAFEVSERTLIYLEKHMNIKNNLTKIDLFAVPYNKNSDISPAWGLILYRESSVTYEPFKQPVNVKADRALTVVSGLLHQLIRNVMPYPSESFKYASIMSGLSAYLSYYIVDKLYPDWRELDRLRVRTTTNLADRVYDSDEYMPIEWGSYEEAPCHRFRAGSNEWGAVVYRMLSKIVSEDVFKAGIAKFINDNQFATITSDHLWNAFQSIYDSNKKGSNDTLSIKQVMKNWTEQRGYPLLNVTRDYKTGKVVITQRSNVVNDTSSRWWVPITFATKSNPDFAKTTPTHWLRPEDESLIIDGVDKDDWIIVNIQLSGFYRVDYDECNWKRVAEYMNGENYQKIHFLNRAQLLSDLYYMIRLNHQNITTFFELAKYLNHEDDDIPWSQAIDIVSNLRNAIFDDDADAAIANFFVKRMDKLIEKFGFEDRSGYDWVKKYKPFYDSLDNRTKKFVPVEKALEKFYKDGYRDEDFSTKRYREQVLLFACALGHPKCLDSAKSQLSANLENATENPISVNLEAWVQCAGAAGNEDHLLRMVNSSMGTSHLKYISCSPDKTVLWKFVEGVLTGELKSGECQLFSALRGFMKTPYVPRNYTHLRRMVVYFMQNFDRVDNYYREHLATGQPTTSTRYTATLLKDYIYHIPTLGQLRQANDMIRNFTSNLPSIINDYINEQTKRIEWSEKTARIINEWIANSTSPVAATA